jgi:8-oxo-dGTP diphosphatase
MATNRFNLLCAVHLFLFREDRVLLLRRFNTGYEDGKYSVIAGHLDGAEEVKAAAVREAREEVGIEVSAVDVRVVGVMHRMSNDERIDFFVTAASWSGEIANREPQSCDHVAWFSVDELPENTIPYVRQALDNYRRGIWFDSYGWP